RRAQLDELARAIEEDSRGRPLIVGGDLNLAAARASDRDDLIGFRERLSLLDTGARPGLPRGGGYDPLGARDALMGFRERLSLLDTGARPELPGWGGYDHLWVRDGHGVHVRVLDAGE